MRPGFNEDDFSKWFSGWADKTGINPNPDDVRHHYDYRGAYMAGANPEKGETGEYHWPSSYKRSTHPNRFVEGVDTITGDSMPIDEAFLKRREQENLSAMEERLSARAQAEEAQRKPGEQPTREPEGPGIGERLRTEAAGWIKATHQNLSRQIGIADGLASVVSGLYGTLAGGWGYLAGGFDNEVKPFDPYSEQDKTPLPGGGLASWSPERAAAAKKAVEQALIHSPMTEEGKAFLGTAMAPLGALAELAEKVGDSEFKRTKNAAWAATVYTAIIGSPMIVPFARRIGRKIRETYNLGEHIGEVQVTDMVVQDLADLLKNPLWKEKGMTEGDIVRHLGGKYKEQAIGSRGLGGPTTSVGGADQRMGRPSSRNISTEAPSTEWPSQSASTGPIPGSLTQEPPLRTSAMSAPLESGRTLTRSPVGQGGMMEYLGYRSGITQPPDNKLQQAGEVVKRQPSMSVDELMTMAEAEQTGLQRTLDEIRVSLGGERADVRVKNIERVHEKIQQKGRTPDQIMDYLGGRLAVDPMETQGAFEEMARVRGLRLIEKENYFEKPNESGYRGINYIYELPSGLKVELQLQTPEGLKVADKDMHVIFEKWRTIQAQNKGEIPPELLLEREADRALSRSIGEKAQSEFLAKKASEQKATRERRAAEEKQAIEGEPKAAAAAREKKIVNQVSPIEPIENIIEGSPTRILHGQGEDAGHYALVELPDLITSHQAGKGFAVNPKYPQQVQERQYHSDKTEQGKVISNAQKYNAQYTVNTDPTVVNGPPVVTKEGIILGGNSRAMTLELLYRDHPERAAAYKDYLKRQAGIFGLDPTQVEGMKSPVLVRAIDEKITDPAELSKRVRLYNQPPTHGIKASTEGIAKARLVSPDTMERMAAALESHGTLRDYLGSAGSRELISDLVKDGVLEEGQLNKLVNEKNGLLTEDGKRSVEQVLRGKVIDDADLMDAVPASTLQALDKSLPFLVRLKARGDAWDISGPLKQALDSLAKMKAQGFRTPEEYLAQGDFFAKDPAGTDPQVHALFMALNKRKPLELKTGFEDLARAAAADVPNQATMAFFTPETAEQAFTRIFGKQDLGVSETQSPYATAVKEFGEESPLVREQLSLFNEDLQRKLQAEIPTYSENVQTKSGKMGLEGAGIHTLGVAINSELANKGRVELTGRTVKSAQDVAVVAQVFRNPQFETLRFIYLKGNTIVAHEGVSSRMPGFSVAFIEDKPKAIFQMKERMARLKADGYYLLHNHPSGNVTASADDAALTELFNRDVPGFKGHVIIDGGKFSVLTKPKGEGDFITADMRVLPVPGIPPNWIDPLLHPAIPHEALGKKLMSPVDIAMIGRSLKTPEKYVTLLYRSSKATIRAIQQVPAGLFNTVKDASNFLRGQAKAFGAGDVVAYAGAEVAIPETVQADLIRSGSLLDIVYNLPPHFSFEQAGQISAREIAGVGVSRAKFGRYEKDYKARRVTEENPEYRVSPVMVSEKPADYGSPEGNLYIHQPIPEIPDKAININLNRIKAGSDIKEAITKIAALYEPTIQAARRGTVSREQTERLADDLGMTVDDLLSRRQGEAYNPHEALAARKILVTSAQELAALARRVTVGEGSPKLLLDFAEAYHRHSAIQAQVSGLTAEAGRTLDIFNRMVEPGAFNVGRIRPIQGGVAPTPEPAPPTRPVNVKQLQEVLDALGGEKSLTTIADVITTTMDTPGKVSKFVRDSQKATTWDMFMEAWINALLTGPATHTVNALGNTITAAWQIPERLLASEIGRVMKGPREITEKEAMYQAYGLVQGAKDGFRLAWEALKTGESSDAMTKLDLPRQSAITGKNLGLSGPAGGAFDLLGEVIRIPGRALMTSDEFFKAVGYRMELNAQAFRKASLEGKEGEALAARMQEIIDNPVFHQDVNLAAIDAMRYQTFTNKLTGASAMVPVIVSKAPAVRLIIPFVRTPVNIMRFVGERTPLAPLSSEVQADIAAGGAKRDLALAKIALGSIIMATAATMAAEGLITGNGPKEPNQRAALLRTGWQPYSLHIGDKYYSFSRVDPISATLGLAADAAEIIGQADEESSGDLATASVISVSRNVTSKNYLRGLSEVFQVMSDPDRYGEKYIQHMFGTIVPTGVAQLNRSIDPTLRDVHSVMDQIRSRIPGLSSDLPPRRNLWGEPITLPPGLGPDIISPIYVSTRKESPVDEEIIRNKIKVGMPSKQVSGVDLTPQEYSRYVELAGNAAKNPSTGLGCKETLEKLVKSPDYKKASDGEEGGRALMIQATITAFRQLAGVKLQEEFADFQGLVINKAKERMEALQPKRQANGPQFAQ